MGPKKNICPLHRKCAKKANKTDMNLLRREKKTVSKLAKPNSTEPNRSLHQLCVVCWSQGLQLTQALANVYKVDSYVTSPNTIKSQIQNPNVLRQRERLKTVMPKKRNKSFCDVTGQKATAFRRKPHIAEWRGE